MLEALETSGITKLFGQTALTTRALCICGVISNSKLSDTEQRHGQLLVRKLAYLAGNEDVPRPEAAQWLDRLTGGQRIKMAELKRFRPETQALSNWLAELDKRLAGFEVDEAKLNIGTASRLGPPNAEDHLTEQPLNDVLAEHQVPQTTEGLLKAIGITEQSVLEHPQSKVLAEEIGPQLVDFLQQIQENQVQ